MFWGDTGLERKNKQLRNWGLGKRLNIRERDWIVLIAKKILLL